MNCLVRDGRFDVVIAAGPRVEHWPSVGVRALALICAEMGLTVGVFGGETITVKGVFPLSGTGGLVLAQDVQGRIHRIHARAVVRVSTCPPFPEPFPGWRSQGLLPLSTAQRLQRESRLQWNPLTVILGTGNRALRFGAELLDAGVSEVICVETRSDWGAKSFSGWEVQKRRFEKGGGRLIVARPLSLTSKAPLVWEFRLQDHFGVRVLEVARVVSAGPFYDVPEIKEHPPGSLLFELTQTASPTQAEDFEGWVLEEERARVLAGKVVKALVNEIGTKREELEKIVKKAKGRLKRYFTHRDEPFQPRYDGKWIAVADARKMRQFRGTPQIEHKKRKIAALECFEEIPCNLCQGACPEKAIEIGRVPRTKDFILDETRCIGCGVCVDICPSGAISMIQEREEYPTSVLVLPWKGTRHWKAGESVVLVNRRGESLGSSRVTGILPLAESKTQLVEVDVPNHLLWEARGLKKNRSATTAVALEDEHYLESVSRQSDAAEERKAEITLDGERRLVRDQIPLSMALFEIGRGRPDDALICPDGSCGLCLVNVDGVNKLACQTPTHRGMAVKLAGRVSVTQPSVQSGLEDFLCPCQRVRSQEVIERLAQGKLQSPEAVLSVTHIGEGRCHGQLCMDAFRAELMNQGLDVSQWIDWRFPWSDWVLTDS